jgi:hypothetical protein
MYDRGGECTYAFSMAIWLTRKRTVKKEIRDALDVTLEVFLRTRS